MISTKYSESFWLAVKEKIQVRPRDGAYYPITYAGRVLY